MRDGRTAYVTGGTGFLGLALVRLLRREGLETTCLVRRPSPELERLGVRQAQGDFTRRECLAESLPGHSWVFHLAAHVAFGEDGHQQEEMYRVNVLGTRAVLEEAWRAGAERIVYCGSVGALGSSGPPGRVVDERNPHDGRFQSLYVKTKYEARQVARELAAAGAPVLSAHPGPAYGPGGVSVVGRQLLLLLRGKMKVMPRVSGIHSYCHVEDVARGLYLVAEKGRVGEEYLLTGEPVTLDAFYGVVAGLAGIRRPRRLVPARLLRGLSRVYESSPLARRLLRGLPLDGEEVRMVLDANWAFSSEKAHRELGWSARSLAEGLPETIAWLRAHDAELRLPDWALPREREPRPVRRRRHAPSVRATVNGGP